MNRDSSDDFMDDLVARDLAGTHTEFSDEDIEFARRNPTLLRKLADPLEVKKRYLYVLFGAATVLAIVSKALEYTHVLDGHPIAHDLLTNVMFSVSIELFGAATVAFVMELVFQKRVAQNRSLVSALARESGTATDPSLGSTRDPVRRAPGTTPPPVEDVADPVE
ncbi:hypothetical protein PQI51_08500 [Microbacterium esteraromaticum]|uniref:hypothetical protein n=1 Tax=Microbacterium esteraromaticum TaxID=57043 RepID=UPI0030A4DD25